MKTIRHLTMKTIRHLTPATTFTAIFAAIFAALLLLVFPGNVSGQVIAWGSNNFGQTTVPAGAQTGVTAIAGGMYHTVALKSDGSVIAWGWNSYGQTNVPAGAQTGVTAIAAGGSHTVALKSDGSVLAWGDNRSGQTTVPAGAESGVTAIAAGYYHTVALKSDGSVVAWGYNSYGQTTVPAGAQTGVTAIAAGYFHTVALKSDGSVIAWGFNGWGQTDVPPGAESGVTAIAAGYSLTVALKSDGSVIAWGDNYSGQTTVPDGAQTGVTAIAAGGGHTVALVAAASDCVTTEIAAKGAPVPGAGVDGSGIPTGAVFASFGVPAINDAGDVAFLGKWTSPTGSGVGLFAGNPAVLVVKKGDVATGAAKFSAFKDPVLNAAGKIAFSATLTGAGITSGNKMALFTNAFDGGAMTLVAQKGATADVADGATLLSFASFSLQGAEVLYVATLQAGTPLVTGENRSAAYSVTASATTKVVRTGQVFGATTVKSFKLLAAATGSPGQNRSHTEGGAAFLVLLADATQALVDGTEGTLTAFVQSAQLTGGTVLPEAKFKTFGPVAAPDTSYAAMVATLTSGVRGVTGMNAKGIFLGSGSAFEPVARITGATGIGAATFSAFNNPVLAPGTGAIAFAATIEGLGVVTSADNKTLWWQPAGGALTLLAREGAEPAETGAGVKWKAFTSLAIAGGGVGRPLFYATLLQDSGGVTAVNDAGLWAMDSTGELRLLAREGDVIGAKTLKSLTVLTAVAGSPGVTRSFNNAGGVIYRATHTDGSQALMRVQVP